VSKTFPGQVALRKVDLCVKPGEIHALVGHNGSGKSTLIKVLAGFHSPDRGAATCRIGGVDAHFNDSEGIRRLGVRFIHQGLGLIESLSVLENLRLGRGHFQTGTLWRIRWRAERRAVRQLLGRLGMTEVNPEARVSLLSAIHKTGVAICRALDDDDNAKVFIFDEPTATLPDDEVERLFGIIRDLAARNIGIVYVSHRLEEIYAIADRVTVLRDGEVVASGSVDEVPREMLTSLIIGEDAEVEIAGRPAPPSRSGFSDREALVLRDVVTKECDGLSFTVSEGEILGIAGLAGSGVHDIPALLLGQTTMTAGSVSCYGTTMSKLGPRELRARHIAVLPSSTEQKAILSMSVRENLTLSSLKPYFRRGWFRQRAEAADVREELNRFEVRPTDPERPMATLSGGNRQKVCVAKWLRTSPRVLVLDEPTQGVDVRGKSEILGLLADVAINQAVAIVVCSSDLDDLAGFCERVLVIRRGRVTDELKGQEVTREHILGRSYAG
jgi:ribose transport system ATP-binding protein